MNKLAIFISNEYIMKRSNDRQSFFQTIGRRRTILTCLITHQNRVVLGNLPFLPHGSLTTVFCSKCSTVFDNISSWWRSTVVEGPRCALAIGFGHTNWSVSDTSHFNDKQSVPIKTKQLFVNSSVRKRKKRPSNTAQNHSHIAESLPVAQTLAPMPRQQLRWWSMQH